MLPDEELVDDGSDADFDSGYAGTPTGKSPETPVNGKETTVAAETTAGDGKVAEVAPPAPEYVQLTKADFEELKAKTAIYDKQLASLNGSVGFLKQHIKPAAEPSAPVTPPADADAATKQKYNEAILEHELTVLAAEFPNWREIVGAPAQGGAENVDPKHPYRVWLAAQPAEYQAKINNANSSLIVMRSIEKFNEDTAKAKAAAVKPPASPQADQRRAVIRNAQQPKGDGGAPPPAKTEDDHFAEGFASG